MTTRDWTQIKTEYVTGQVSLRDLAQKHGVSLGAIGTHCASENWDAEREQKRTELNVVIDKEATKRELDKAYTALEVCDTIIDKFMNSLPLQKVTAFDAMNAARFKEVLRGGIESRNETITRNGGDWREGLTEQEVAQIEQWANIRQGNDSGEGQSGEDRGGEGTPH